MKRIIAVLGLLLMGCTTSGTVIEKTYEGYAYYNDYYLVELEDGNIHEIEADDLDVGDKVQVTFIGDCPIYMIYKG